MPNTVSASQSSVSYYQNLLNSSRRRNAEAERSEQEAASAAARALTAASEDTASEAEEAAAAQETESAGKTESESAIDIAALKHTISLAILRANWKQGSATTATATKPAHQTFGQLSTVKTYEKNYTVKIGEDESSTVDNPVMYVETETNGVKQAYLVDIGKIDPDNMTKVEALALKQYMDKNSDWGGISQSDMLAAMTEFWAENGDGSSLMDYFNQLKEVGSSDKSTFTYNQSGQYSSSGSLLEANRDLREMGRALWLKNTLSDMGMSHLLTSGSNSSLGKYWG